MDLPVLDLSCCSSHTAVCTRRLLLGGLLMDENVTFFTCSQTLFTLEPFAGCLWSVFITRVTEAGHEPDSEGGGMRVRVSGHGIKNTGEL